MDRVGRCCAGYLRSRLPRRGAGRVATKEHHYLLRSIADTTSIPKCRTGEKI